MSEITIAAKACDWTRPIPETPRQPFVTFVTAAIAVCASSAAIIARMLSCCIILIFALVCVPNSAKAQKQEEAAIRDILRAQTEAWNHGDGNEWARDFTDDCDFVSLRGDTYHTRADLGARVSVALQGRLKGSRLSLSIRRFSLLAPTVALIEADEDISHFQGVIPGVPQSAGVLRTHIIYVAVRRDGRWRFVAGQNTPILPPAPQR